MLLRELDNDYVGVQDNSDASAAATSHAAAKSYESELPSSDEAAPAARRIDLPRISSTCIVEYGSDNEEVIVSVTDDVHG